MNTNPEYAEFVKAANQHLVDSLITSGVGAMCVTMELYIQKAAQIGGTGGFRKVNEPVVTTNPLVYAPGTRVRYNGSGVLYAVPAERLSLQRSISTTVEWSNTPQKAQRGSHTQNLIGWQTRHLNHCKSCERASSVRVNWRVTTTLKQKRLLKRA